MYGNNFYVGCLFIKRQSQLRRENACTSELQFLALLISRSRPVAASLKIQTGCKRTIACFVQGGINHEMADSVSHSFGDRAFVAWS